MRRLAAIVLAVALATAACGGDEQPATTAEAASAAAPATSAASAAPASAAPRVETVDVGDGATLEYVAVEPPGFDPATPHQVVLALPPGGQDRDTALRLTEENYAANAIARGWVVVSPVAPSDGLFFQGSERLLPGFMDAMAERYAPPDGRFVLVGVSNGGLSAFRIAALAPERFSVLLAYPGYPSSPEDEAALPQLAKIPVRLFVGGDDSGWLEGSRAATAALEAAGGDVELVVVPGEGHIIGALQGGEQLFAALDAALA